MPEINKDNGYNKDNMSLSDIRDVESGYNNYNNKESDIEINGLSERNGNSD